MISDKEHLWNSVKTMNACQIEEHFFKIANRINTFNGVTSTSLEYRIWIIKLSVTNQKSIFCSYSWERKRRDFIFGLLFHRSPAYSTLWARLQ